MNPKRGMSRAENSSNVMAPSAMGSQGHRRLFAINPTALKRDKWELVWAKSKKLQMAEGYTLHSRGYSQTLYQD